MKPIIIYTMPRTKSSAVLEACLKKNKISEPFNEYNLFDINFSNLDVENYIKLEMYEKEIKKIHNLYPSYLKKIKKKNTQILFEKLNDKETASKIFGINLTDFLPGRKWFQNADEFQTHEIFVLTRDLKEQMFSFLLAPIFGYNYKNTVEPYDVEIKEDSFYFLRKNIDEFLRFFPKNGKLITFEELPDLFFDKKNIKIKEQNSLEKLKYIKNLKKCEKHIDDLVLYFKDEWKEKIDSIK